MKPWKTATAVPRELAKLPRPVKFISGLFFVFSICWGITNPFFPIFFKEMLGTYTATGIVTGILFLFLFFFSILIGGLADKISKRALMTIGFAIYIPVGLIITSLKRFADFMFFRLYHSIANATLWTSGEAYLREHSPAGKTSESMGLFDTMYNLAVFIGAVASGFLFMIFGYSIFLAISIFAAAAFLLSFFTPDHHRTRLKKRMRLFLDGAKAAPDGFRTFGANKTLIKITVAYAAVSFCSNFLAMMLPLFSEELRASMIQIGLIYAAFILPTIFEAHFSVLTERIGKKKVFRGGLIAAVVLFGLMTFTTHITSLFLLALGLSLALSALWPPLDGKTTELMPKRIVGEMTGVVRSVRLIGSGLGPIVAGVLADIFGLRYVFLLGAAMLFGVLAFSARLKF